MVEKVSKKCTKSRNGWENHGGKQGFGESWGLTLEPMSVDRNNLLLPLKSIYIQIQCYLL